MPRWHFGIVNQDSVLQKDNIIGYTRKKYFYIAILFQLIYLYEYAI